MGSLHPFFNADAYANLKKFGDRTICKFAWNPILNNPYNFGNVFFQKSKFQITKSPHNDTFRLKYPCFHVWDCFSNSWFSGSQQILGFCQTNITHIVRCFTIGKRCFIPLRCLICKILSDPSFYSFNNDCTYITSAFYWWKYILNWKCGLYDFPIQYFGCCSIPQTLRY